MMKTKEFFIQLFAAGMAAGSRDPLPFGSGVKLVEGGRLLPPRVTVSIADPQLGVGMETDIVGPGLPPEWPGIRDAVFKPCRGSEFEEGIKTSTVPEFRRFWTCTPMWRSVPTEDEAAGVIKDHYTGKMVYVIPLRGTDTTRHGVGRWLPGMGHEKIVAPFWTPLFWGINYRTTTGWLDWFPTPVTPLDTVDPGEERRAAAVGGDDVYFAILPEPVRRTATGKAAKKAYVFPRGSFLTSTFRADMGENPYDTEFSLLPADEAVQAEMEGCLGTPGLLTLKEMIGWEE